MPLKFLRLQMAVYAAVVCKTRNVEWNAMWNATWNGMWNGMWNGCKCRDLHCSGFRITDRMSAGLD